MPNVIKAAQGDKKFLVHGDLGVESIHANSNDAKFSGFDWATISDNEALALVFDYGNLRGRAAGNSKLQEAMDDAIREKFEDNHELGEAIIVLATLRTSLKFIKYRMRKNSHFNKDQADSHDEDFKRFFPKAGEVEAKTYNFNLVLQKYGAEKRCYIFLLF